MVQEYKKIAVVGAGASGCICAYHLTSEDCCEVTIFDKGEPLRTLLPTGGGRCNLAHAEYDYKELAKNYPRGEKFLYSVFSKFSTSDTVEMFESMGIKTYTQNDGRIFPISDNSKFVRDVIIDKLQTRGVKFVRKEIVDLWKLLKEFDYVVIATGGHSGYEMLEYFDIKIVPQRPSLVGLSTKEKFKTLSGIVCKDVLIDGLMGDLLFTHFGISGPIVYKLSSYRAYNDYPYTVTVDFFSQEFDFQKILNQYSKRDVKNILGKYLPQKLADYILDSLQINCRGCDVNRIIREEILQYVHNFKITITGTNIGEETVTAGGVLLNEINSKTMEVKKVPNLYCIGEVLDIDGLCGGFNLQNAWSTAYVCAEAIKSCIKV
ncbi:MAG: aminoacetone oxidase family FAD-binding enzyme [bacterium]|nr:aminoacetone oxidase family FAD-binding enzyme [bacterium]